MEENKTDKMEASKAAETRILIAEDIAKLRLAKAQALGRVAMIDAQIAECELGLADVDRREAGVVYPEPPAQAPAKAAEAESAPGAMQEPVGGK